MTYKKKRTLSISERERARSEKSLDNLMGPGLGAIRFPSAKAPFDHARALQLYREGLAARHDTSDGSKSSIPNIEDIHRQVEREKRVREHANQREMLTKLNLKSIDDFFKLSISELEAKFHLLDRTELKLIFNSLLMEKKDAELRDCLQTVWMNSLGSIKVRQIYEDSDTPLYELLHQKLLGNGPSGVLASLCLRLQKCYYDKRAKDGYKKKKYAHQKIFKHVHDILQHLHNNRGLVGKINLLSACNLRFHDFFFHSFNSVLFVELPTGPVCWPVREPEKSPPYEGPWVRRAVSEKNVLRFAESVLGSIDSEQGEPSSMQ